jgi:hypothetical protein
MPRTCFSVVGFPVASVKAQAVGTLAAISIAYLVGVVGGLVSAVPAAVVGRNGGTSGRGRSAMRTMVASAS